MSTKPTTQDTKSITRKAVDLDSETIKALTIQAALSGQLLKPYLEDVLIAQAAVKTEEVTEEHY